MSRRPSLSKLLGCAGISLLITGTASAGRVIVVDEQTQAAIQLALNRLGGPGTVIVPEGRYLINTVLIIRNSGVTLQGDGPDRTILYRDVDGTNTPLVRSIGNSRVRITGIRFEGDTRPDPIQGEQSRGREIGVELRDAADFRVDNSYFTHTGFGGVSTRGASNGVVDHCTFVDNYKPRVGTEGYGVVVYGNDDPLEHEPFGSELATFVEDSVFLLCRHAVAANRGARYVFRNNYVAQNEVAHAVDAHGTEYSSVVGTDWIDVHDNVIEDPSYAGPPCGGDSAACFAVHIRGGTGLIWNNAFRQYNQGIHLRWDTTEPTGPVYIWNNDLIVPEGSRSRCPDSPTSPMLCVVGSQGTPTFFLSPPDDYQPFPYPHPLTVPP